MSQVLYRKYRPQTFEELTGQEHVVRTLKGALSSGRIGHAYLFSGPRGVGKTTTARLLAKALNCANFPRISTGNSDGKLSIRRSFSEGGQYPCNKCSSCIAINIGNSLDIIEIDGASNRGIDEIRNLKDSARVAAASGGYKVFIIDEVHMLTPPAFSALLKTIEEPPAHVIFILATTESHKIPATILSRVQRFEYKKITLDQIVQRLQKIAKLEKVTLDKDAAMAIAHSAEGALRDAESSLTKLVSFAGDPSIGSGQVEITLEQVKAVLGIVPSEVHFGFLKSLLTSESKISLGMIENLYESGVNLDVFLKQFVNYLRLVLLWKVNPELAWSSGKVSEEEEQQWSGMLTAVPNEKLIKIINKMVGIKNEIKNSPIPQLPLELAVMEIHSGITSN